MTFHLSPSSAFTSQYGCCVTLGNIAMLTNVNNASLVRAVQFSHFHGINLLIADETHISHDPNSIILLADKPC